MTLGVVMITRAPLVIQPGKTHAEAARTMLAQLNRAGAHVVGVVLNRVPRSTGSYYGYYRYESDAIGNETNAAGSAPGGYRKGLASMFSGNGKAVNKDIGEKIA